MLGCEGTGQPPPRSEFADVWLTGPALDVARVSLKPSIGTGIRGRFSGKFGNHSGLSLDGVLKMGRRSGRIDRHGPCSGDCGRKNTRGIVEPSAEELVAGGSPAVHAASNAAKAIGEARVILASRMGDDDGRRQ